MGIVIYVAIYGALLSTIAILWNIWRDLSDKAKVKVSAGVGILTYKQGAKTRVAYFFSAVNSGKRPVTLTSAGLGIEDNKNMIFMEAEFPKKLEEGERFVFYRMCTDFYPEVKKHKVEYLWFKDSLEKTYKNRAVRTLFSQEYKDE